MAIEKLADVIHDLCDLLFEAETRRLDTTVKQLDQSNREIKGNSLHGFIHGGEIYRPSNAPVRATRTSDYPTLAFTLCNDAEAFVNDSKTLKADRKLIEQILFKLLYQCNDIQEVRDSLPECLVQLVPGLAKMPRKCTEGFIIRHDPRAHRQYLAVLPKIEFYAMTRLIY